MEEKQGWVAYGFLFSRDRANLNWRCFCGLFHGLELGGDVLCRALRVWGDKTCHITLHRQVLSQPKHQAGAEPADFAQRWPFADKGRKAHGLLDWEVAARPSSKWPAGLAVQHSATVAMG